MMPARIATVGSKTVRFYLSPLEGPDFPWVSFGDVASLLFPSPEHRTLLEERWEAEYPDLVRRADDASMIVPDYSARGMFQWAGESGLDRAWALARAYEESAAEVLASLYGDLPRSVLSNFIREASLRNSPMEKLAYAN